MFYALEIEPAEDDDGEEIDYFALELLDESLSELPWYRGVAFTEPPAQPIALKVDLSNKAAEAPADYLLEPIPLASGRLRMALEAAGVSNVQWFATEVRNAKSWRHRTEYFAMNVVGLVAAGDPARTVSSRPLRVMGADEIRSFAVDESRCAGLKLFRLAEHMATLVVSESVREKIEEASIDTLALVPLEGWSS